MKKSIVILVLSAAAASAQALSPQAESLLRKAGLDPQSPEVRRAEQDGVIHTTYRGDPEEWSLESLAVMGRTNGVKTFVGTREYIRRLKSDFAGTPFPPVADFDTLYLTPAERELVANRSAAMTQEERDLYLKRLRTGK